MIIGCRLRLNLHASFQNPGESDYITPAASATKNSTVRELVEFRLFSSQDRIALNQTSVRGDDSKIFTSDTNNSSVRNSISIVTVFIRW